LADKIQLEGMTFYGFHGVNDAEKELGQRFVVDIEVYRDLRPAGASDDLDDTVSYTHVYRIVKDVIEGPSRNLLESLAEMIASNVLDRLEVEAVAVKVRKPEVPIKGSILSHTSVEIFREKG